jgi:hypothetical protein
MAKRKCSEAKIIAALKRADAGLTYEEYDANSNRAQLSLNVATTAPMLSPQFRSLLRRRRCGFSCAGESEHLHR